MGAQRVTLRVPAMLRSLARGHSAVIVEAMPSQPGALILRDVLAALEKGYPGLHDAALDERGAVRQHVNLFVGAENVRLGAGLATPVSSQTEVWILPAVSGG